MGQTADDDHPAGPAHIAHNPDNTRPRSSYRAAHGADMASLRLWRTEGPTACFGVTDQSLGLAPTVASVTLPLAARPPSAELSSACCPTWGQAGHGGYGE